MNNTSDEAKAAMVENANISTVVILDVNTDPREERRRRSLANYVKVFHNVSNCRHYIETRKNENIVLIAASYLGQIIMPNIHPLSQLTAVYIYCSDERKTEEWTKCYTKVSMNKSLLLIERNNRLVFI
jgi:hypothetical protein